MSAIAFSIVVPCYNEALRLQTAAYAAWARASQEVGLLFVDESVEDVHELNQTTQIPLSRVPYESLCPGAGALARMQESFR